MSVREIQSKAGIDVAKHAAKTLKASKGAIILAFDDNGTFSAISYGFTRAKCDEMRLVADRLVCFLKSGGDAFVEELAAVLQSDNMTIFEAMIEHIRDKVTVGDAGNVSP